MVNVITTNPNSRVDDGTVTVTSGGKIVSVTTYRNGEAVGSNSSSSSSSSSSSGGSSSSGSSIRVPQYVFNPESNSWVNLSTHKIVNGVPVPRTEPDNTVRSGYASPTSNKIYDSAEALNKDLAVQNLPKEVYDRTPGATWLNRALEAGNKAAAYNEVKAQADKAVAAGYNTIIKENKEGYTLDIVAGEKKAKELEKYAFTKVGGELRTENPVGSEARLAWFDPFSFVFARGDKRDERVGRLDYRFNTNTEKYGTVLGSLVSSISSPAFILAGSSLVGYGAGVLVGKATISAATGSKIGAVTLMGGQTLGAVVAGQIVGKSIQVGLSKDIYYDKGFKANELDLDAFDKGTYFTNLAAGIAGGRIGYGAGYTKATDPYFQVESQSWVKGNREQGLVYEKNGLSGSSSKEFRTIYKPFNNKQFQADSYAQERYTLTKLGAVSKNIFYARTSRVTVENSLLGTNLKTGTSQLTKLPSQVFTSSGLAVVRYSRTYDMNTLTDYGMFREGTTISGGSVTGGYKGDKQGGVFKQDYVSFDLKGKGTTLSDSRTVSSVNGKIVEFNPPISSTTFRPVEEFGLTDKSSSLFNIGKKGSLNLGGGTGNQLQIVEGGIIPKVTGLTTPKVSTIQLTTPGVLTGGTIAGAIVGGATKLGLDVLTQSDTRIASMLYTSTYIYTGTMVVPKTSTVPKVTTRSFTTTMPITVTKTEPLLVPVTTPATTPLTSTPHLPLGVPSWWNSTRGYTSSRQESFTRASRGYGYTPSLTSAILGITTKKTPKNMTYSGFEARPIVISGKKKRKMF